MACSGISTVRSKSTSLSNNILELSESLSAPLPLHTKKLRHFMSMYTCTHTYSHTYVLARIRTCTHTCMHGHTHARKHAQTHTHTPAITFSRIPMHRVYVYMRNWSLSTLPHAQHKPTLHYVVLNIKSTWGHLSRLCTLQLTLDTLRTKLFTAH